MFGRLLIPILRHCGDRCERAGASAARFTPLAGGFPGFGAEARPVGGAQMETRWTVAKAGSRFAPMSEAPDIQELTFEQALAELEQIVARLESGQAPLEDSIRLYERGAVLKTHCETRLEAARLRVEKIVMGAGGAVTAESAEFS
jgi:exodeoxyribonuclease VII small subunit